MLAWPKTRVSCLPPRARARPWSGAVQMLVVVRKRGAQPHRVESGCCFCPVRDGREFCPFMDAVVSLRRIRAFGFLQAIIWSGLMLSSVDGG